MRDILQALSRLTVRWDSRDGWLTAGRCMVAVATLSEVVFTSDSGLFGSVVPADVNGLRCDAIRSISLWCVSAASTHGILLARLASIGVLLLVISGYRPRWTCIPHWYISFSLFSVLPVPNGGDGAAEIAALLLIPICLGDVREWMWRSPRSLPSPAWRGAAFAAHMLVRLQLVIVYVSAAVSKIIDPAWRQGVAMYYVFHDPWFGIPEKSWSALTVLLASHTVVAAFTWSVIALQLTIAVTVVGSRRMRQAALVLGVCLHLAIMLLMGLPSFGLIMIGLLVVGYGGSLVNRPGRVVDAESGAALLVSH
nr:sporulation-delaying protein SdpB family protein [Kutzneria sp. 744]